MQEKGYRHSQETDGVLWYCESNKVASVIWKVENSFGIETGKNKIAFDTKVWREVLLAHYHGLRTPRESFFSKISNFWAWADILG